jgi:hypothetical protein
MIAAAFLALLLQATAPAGSERETPGQRALREHPQTLLIFFRAQAFHDMAAARDCLRVAPQRTRDLNARFESARTRFAALVGPGVVEQPGSAPASSSGGGHCEGDGLLLGYEDKLAALERSLAGGAP